MKKKVFMMIGPLLLCEVFSDAFAPPKKVPTPPGEESKQQKESEQKVAECQKFLKEMLSQELGKKRPEQSEQEFIEKFNQMISQQVEAQVEEKIKQYFKQVKNQSSSINYTKVNESYYTNSEDEQEVFQTSKEISAIPQQHMPSSLTVSEFKGFLQNQKHSPKNLSPLESKKQRTQTNANLSPNQAQKRSHKKKVFASQVLDTSNSKILPQQSEEEEFLNREFQKASLDPKRKNANLDLKDLEPQSVEVKHSERGSVWGCLQNCCQNICFCFIPSYYEDASGSKTNGQQYSNLLTSDLQDPPKLVCAGAIDRNQQNRLTKAPDSLEVQKRNLMQNKQNNESPPEKPNIGLVPTGYQLFKTPPGQAGQETGSLEQTAAFKKLEYDAYSGEKIKKNMRYQKENNPQEVEDFFNQKNFTTEDVAEQFKQLQISSKNVRNE